MRLLDLPAILEPPEDILGRLQALDPRVDLLYVGGGEWWLGRVKPDSYRRRAGIKMLETLDRQTPATVRPTYLVPVPASPWDRWKERHVPAWLRWLLPVRTETVRVQGAGLSCPWVYERQARLMMAGFGLIEQVVQPFPPDGRIVELYRVGHWLMQHTPSHEVDRRMFDLMSGKAAKEARGARMLDYIHTEGRWYHKRITGHSLRLAVNGLRTA